jgi:hypothetical protein
MGEKIIKLCVLSIFCCVFIFLRSVKFLSGFCSIIAVMEGEGAGISMKNHAATANHQKNQLFINSKCISNGTEDINCII